MEVLKEYLRKIILKEMLTNSVHYLKEEYLTEMDLVDHMIQVIKNQQKKK
jgi:hypothetical protein